MTPAPRLSLAAGSPPTPPQAITSQRLLTARGVAELLGVCPETVLRWIRDGQLPAIRLPGGAIRISESQLDDWLAERATPGRGVLAATTGAATDERYRRAYNRRR